METKTKETTDDELLKEYSGLAKGLVKVGDDEWIGTREQWDTYDNVMGEEVLEDEEGRPFFWDESEEKSYKQYLD